MKEQYKHIENLLMRFFDGETSNREECELYTFFRETDIPEHLQEYKSIFEYFEEGIVKEVEKETPRVEKKNRLVTLGSVAAAILIFLLLKPLLFTEPFNPYEGSYIMKNGKKIYDIEQIEAEQRNIEFQMNQKQKEIDAISNSVDVLLEEYSLN